jgi:hypothetical protein
MKHIYFDEAGFTGNNLLDDNQPIFCYLGLDSSENFEKKFITLKNKYGYNDQEIKGSKLCKSHKGQEFLVRIWEEFNDKVIFVSHDKKYALAAKLYEYTYESVFQDISTLLYRSNFHRFISNLFHSFFIFFDKTAEILFEKFIDFVKNKNANNKLDLIGLKPDKNNPLILFYNFCKNNINEIACDVDFTHPCDHWLLDLTNTSLYSLLIEFSGDSNDEIYAFCDKAKPLLTQLEFINAFVGDKRILYNDLFGFKMRFNFNLATPVTLIDSKESTSIQIADCLVSSIYFSLANNSEQFSKKILKIASTSFDMTHSVRPTIMDHFSNEEIRLHFWLMKELSRKTAKNKKIETIMKYDFLMMQTTLLNKIKS